ncbi:hypothetical protein D3C74_441410 [compost metagenome]
MHTHEGRRTSGLYCKTGAGRIQFVGNACGEKVLVIGHLNLPVIQDMQQLRMAHNMGYIFIRTYPCKYADRSFVLGQAMPGILYCIPGALQK